MCAKIAKESSYPEGYKGMITITSRCYSYRTVNIDPKTGMPLKVTPNSPSALIPESWGPRELRELRAAEKLNSITIHIEDTESYESAEPTVKGSLQVTKTDEEAFKRMTNQVKGLGRPMEGKNDDEIRRFHDKVSNEGIEMPEPPPVEPQDYTNNTTPDNWDVYNDRNGLPELPVNPNWANHAIINTAPDHNKIAALEDEFQNKREVVVKPQTEEEPKRKRKNRKDAESKGSEATITEESEELDS